MGEFAELDGRRIKIGTCENLSYLRADDRHAVSGYDFGEDVLAVVRFRFPFPDEDGLAPGAYDDYYRGVRVPGCSLPETLSGDEHHSVQFTSSAGYVLSIPCPEQYGTPGLGPVDVDGLAVHRNGFNGHPVVRQQAFRGGQLVTLLSCGACGALHRLDTLDDAQPVIDAFRAEADRQEWFGQPQQLRPAHSDTDRERLRAIADRIEVGYTVTVDAAAV